MIMKKCSCEPRSPAELLNLIRTGDIRDWQTLCDHIGMPLSCIGTTNEAGWWEHQIDSLLRTGFIEIDHTTNLVENRDCGPYVPIELNGRFAATDAWKKIQSAFGIGLMDIANMNREGSTVMRPIFGRPSRDKSIDVFVIMPFSKELEPVYTDHILRVCGDLELSAERADDLQASQFIVRDIWQSLNTARVVVADCTGKNPNVFYELGIAHTIGKPTIILTQDDDIPFDINHIRLIKYEYTPRGMSECEKRINDGLRYLLNIYD